MFFDFLRISEVLIFCAKERNTRIFTHGNNTGIYSIVLKGGAGVNVNNSIMSGEQQPVLMLPEIHALQTRRPQRLQGKVDACNPIQPLCCANLQFLQVQ